MFVPPYLSRFRLAWTLLGFIGLALQIISLEIAHPGYFTHLASALNFFSLFTITTNLALTLWFFLAFLSRYTRKASWLIDSPEVKGALMLSGMMTILIYWVLLSGFPTSNIYGRISNFFVHLLVPLGLWIDWLLVGGPITRSFKQTILIWLAYPLLYAFYTEARGLFAHWYPYFFLDPRIIGGFGNVALWILIMILLFMAMGCLIFWLYQRREHFRVVQRYKIFGRSEQAPTSEKPSL